MSKEQKVYIIGHKNPDTDSIISAIAYTDIKNRTTQGINYVVRRAGQINEETEFILNKFGVDAPAYLSDVGHQVRDMEIHQTPKADITISIKTAWELMKESGAVTLPITDKDNKLEGMITVSDIATYYMDAYDKKIMSNARTQYRSMAKTLEGKVIVGNEHGYFIRGEVLIGANHAEVMKQHIKEDDLVILGDREEGQRAAIECNASCLVICLNMQVSDEIIELAKEKSCVIITTPYDTFTVARMINQSIPVKFLMKTEDLVTFKTSDFVDKIKEVMGKLRYRDFPVTDSKGNYVGTVSRRNLINVKKKKLILVDHNEKSQAVENIDQAEILEIIDHHRIGTLETIQPVYFRNQPVGCTATIMFQIYREKNLDIPKHIAGLLCSAIISDTLMFRSPTCTEYDREAAHQLSKIAEIEIETHASEMFRAGSNLSDKQPEEIFYQDFKKFIMGDVAFGVGQITSLNSDELKEIKNRIRPFMETECGNHGISMVFFMLTNIIDESTELLCYGEDCDKLLKDSFSIEIEEGSCYLPSVVSRKKQLIPAFMGALQQTI